MDSISEIRLDEWWQDHLGGCGTCKWRYKQGKYDICEYHGTDCENVIECDEWIEKRIGNDR